MLFYNEKKSQIGNQFHLIILTFYRITCANGLENLKIVKDLTNLNEIMIL